MLAFAVALGALSMAILIALVNPLTAALTFASLIGYAIVYTAWLKRATPQNIVIGGAAGAAPPLLGWTAVTGHVHPYALLLCLIIFVWTPPHFWALAIFRRDDYSRAQVPMLPVTHGVVYTRWHVLYLHDPAARRQRAAVPDRHERLVLSRRRARARRGISLLRDRAAATRPDELFAMKVFNYSIVYLMALFAFLLVDHYLDGPSLHHDVLQLQRLG